jgi:hypothetical protein
MNWGDMDLYGKTAALMMTAFVVLSIVLMSA